MKMNKLFAALSLAASFGMAGESLDQPAYVRASLLSTQGDWRAFSGGRSRGHGFEVGYVMPSAEDERLTFGVFAGYVYSNGQERNEAYFQKTSFSLSAWRAGADLIFKTPLLPLRAYAGLNLQFWDGYQKVDNPIMGTVTGSVGDAKAKFGLRVGAEYRFNTSWGVALEYNASEWRSVAETDPSGSTLHIKGWNPINPSWVALSIQYRFSSLK